MPKPKPNETKNDFIARCIPYVINEGVAKNSEQATAICNSIWSKKNNKKEAEDIKKSEKILFKFNAQIHPKKKIDLSKDEDLDLDIVTMIVGDSYFNGAYFPAEELEKMYHQFEGAPINLNHSDDRVEDIVGFVKDVKFNDGRITGTPVFDKETSKYKEAMGYILSRFKANDFPNVSVGMYGERFEEELDDDSTHFVARNFEADHLALVVHGACNPGTGCGIGIGNSVTVSDNEYVNNTEDEYKNLEKKILMEKIKMEANKWQKKV
jgi:hypothetical protein